MAERIVETGPVALFLPSLAGGGAERSFIKIANDFAAKGIPVDMLLRQKKGPLMDLLDPRVRIISLGGIAGFWALARYVRRHKPRCLMCGLVGPNLVAGILKRTGILPVRLILNVRNMDDEVIARYGPFKRAFCQALYSTALRAADHLVAISKGVQEDYLVGRLGVPRERVQVIYNPWIDPEFHQRRDEPVIQEWFREEGQPYIVAVGRLEPQKDFFTLLRAFHKVREARPIRLLILGEGRERKALERTVREWGLEKDVRLPGFIPNPLPLVKGARLFVLSSIHEGLANVVIEALGCGVPVVSTDCPSGPAEILEGGRWGKLVPVGDWEAMAQAMGEVLEHPPVSDYGECLRRFESGGVIGKYRELLGLE
jgi:glycosyltransferase involved in cell wall biosynthesis